MNQKRIEKMIPIAMDILPTIDAVVNNNRFSILTGGLELPSNYSGYIDSFGPTVRQSGLLQAVTFNEKNDKRKLINKLLFEVIKKASNDGVIGYFEDKISAASDLKGLVISISNSNMEKKKFENIVFETVIACKLAMKTFPKIKAEDNE